ncbi:uncharacterized protein BJ212DRAFT_1304538 [Suillus subaureus]|uniref:Uncharacterized protein n=1 Tax=Suillus subaureus TaxID=48587 RepID=A0A9P7DUK1_9AGAM|nr:uncharacterized protein BJ212DRAFT_1304538 [Suillus subaureus]KAG1803487.1 hypothetical protein BJ212DRAFT_1304538 [Suillus subaureus]
MTILDASSAIIAWYVPDTLTNATQLDDNWRTNQEWFKPSSENDVLTPGCINLSPAWFQQGHENQLDPEVSASLKGASSKKILKVIVRPAAIATAALRVMHPEQYWADHLSIPECFNILTTVGNYSNAQMSMPSLQLEFRRIMRHGVHAVEGDRIAWAWYMRDSIHVYAKVPSCGWARVDYKQ